MILSGRYCMLLALVCVGALALAADPVRAAKADENQSWSNVSRARFWIEGLLFAIRRDAARPPVHARNLFHVSASLWDCWAAYSPDAKQHLHSEKVLGSFSESVTESEREICMSFAVATIMKSRFARSPSKAIIFAEIDRKMALLNLDPSFNDTQNSGSSGLGLRVAKTYIEFGLTDGSNEPANYAVSNGYIPINQPLAPSLTESINYVIDIDHWQPLAVIGTFPNQTTVVQSSYPPFTAPHWGEVTPFSLTSANKTGPGVYLDPGVPPRFASASNSSLWRENHVTVLQYSSWLDPSNSTTLDCSPASRGNSTFPTNDGTGYKKNPKTGLPYTPQIVKRGDYARVLAEFWADGPSSETPPGHWNTILNYVSYSSGFSRQWLGKGRTLNPLEWDVRAYLTLNGAMHDVAITVWGIKHKYDSSRPITALRRMASKGQSSDPLGESYNADGIPLVHDLVEVITSNSSKPGERHEHLAAYVGQIAFKAWHNFVPDARNYSGVGWILGTHWLPYQAKTFVTPPFPGYPSGHSTFSRAAATILASITGDPYFPGGMGEFVAPKDTFLAFESGPSAEVRLQWATYFDAADESGISRIFGGIHPPMDDTPGRIIGSQIGSMSVQKVATLLAPEGSKPLGTAEIASISVIAAEVAILIPLVALILWRRKSQSS